MSPILRFWLHVLGAFAIPTLTTLMALWTQAMAEGTRLPLYGCLIGIGGGVIAASHEGGRTWPSPGPQA